MTLRRVATVALSLALAACGANPSQAPVELTIYGAASLRNAMEQVKPAYESTTPGVSLVIATNSSAALRIQIEQGAPADVFLSADTASPQRLFDAGLVEGGVVFFAANSLVVIVPDDNPADISSPADLARPGLRIVAAGDMVPITRYATQLVDALARLPDYPADFADAYAANVASREDNVQAIVARIGLGEGDAGIVYRTDALASGSVRTVHVPEAAQVEATYAGVVIRGSAHPEAARAFLEWMAGPGGHAVLADFGFLP